MQKKGKTDPHLHDTVDRSLPTEVNWKEKIRSCVFKILSLLYNSPVHPLPCDRPDCEFLISRLAISLAKCYQALPLMKIIPK